MTTRVPFVRGGAEVLADGLVAALHRAGHEAVALSIPFRWYPAEHLLDEMLAARGLRLAGIDRVIGLKFPAYLVPHPRKVMWLVHQHRQAYDMWESGQSDIPDDARGRVIRDAIRAADARCFAGCRGLFAIAGNVAGRLHRFSGFEAEVLPMPLDAPERFGGGAYGPYILAPGRLSGLKRQALLIAAMAHVRAPVRLVIAGAPDVEGAGAALERQVAALGLQDRVTIDARFVPEAEMAALVNGALAVAYVPMDEDAIGYVTMEACQAAKAVVACTDSGGLLELLQDGDTGFVVAPEAAALGAALDRLGHDPALARRLGQQARARLLSRDITWERILARLLA